jgi:hypothetical protein
LIRERDQQTTLMLSQLVGGSQASSSATNFVEPCTLESSSNQIHQTSSLPILSSATSASAVLDVPVPPFSAEILFPNYPSRLPPPDQLFLLIDVFFACYLDAHRIVHRPTLQASLHLPPHLAGFPRTSLLHAICAIASTYASSSELCRHLHTKHSASGMKCKLALISLLACMIPSVESDSNVNLSFGELQAEFARESLRHAINSEDGLFEAFQSQDFKHLNSILKSQW